MNVVEATEMALEAAPHLTETDAGAVEVLRGLAREIDVRDELREFALQWAAETKTRPPGIDNVTVPTYLKFCDALGLTPSGRKALELREAARGKLAEVRDLRERKAPTKKRTSA
ncbi:MAG: hypothetical protein M3499_05190 [Actinomycetota bacterium]|nr:hypothetical protein [Actinomycetota bacterium]